MPYLIVCVLFTIVSFAYLRIADRLNIIDKPNHRSSHTINTIRGGGILFYIAFLSYFIWSGFQLPYLFVGVTLIAVVSFIDDLRPLLPMLRLPFQFLAFALVLLQLDLDYVWLILLLVLICGVGFMNVFNFMDGINGLTGIYSLVILGFFIVFNTYFQEFTDQDLLIFVSLSLIVFGFFNFRKKALFFSGDVGSMSIAVILGYLLLKLYEATQSPAVLLIIGVYGIDGIVTIIKRIFLRESISQAHRHHIYQILTDKAGFGHLKVAISYAFIQALLCAVFFLVYQMGVIQQLFISLLVFSLMIVAYLFINKRFMPETLPFQNSSKL